jgi:hypothetical protein
MTFTPLVATTIRVDNTIWGRGWNSVKIPHGASYVEMETGIHCSPC